MRKLNTKTISIYCCRLALVVTSICIGIQYSIKPPNDFNSSDFWYIFYFCGSYIASEFVARKLPKAGVAGAIFMVGIMLLSASRLFHSVEFTRYVVWHSRQLQTGEESMMGLIIVFEFWIAIVQLAFTALFGGYALLAATKDTVEQEQDHKV